MSKHLWRSLVGLRQRRASARRPSPHGQRCRLGLESLEERALPSTFTVLNAADSGLGSLRQAILNADAGGGPATIRFAILGTGFQVIRPLSALPAVTVPVSIDGFAQPGASPATQTAAAVIDIQLDGALAGPKADGLVLDGGGSTLRGLAITNFQDVGLVLGVHGGDVITGATFTGSLRGNVRIEAAAAGNAIGTSTFDGGITATGAGGGADVDSLIVRSNGNIVQHVFTDGILVTGNRNTIGGDPSGDNIVLRLTGVDLHRNVISGNRNLGGLRLAGSNNLVEDNLIGTDPLGARAVANAAAGVVVTGDNNIIGGVGNFISGNKGDGVVVSGRGNQVLGNFIGLSTGRVGPSSPLGNAGSGVRIAGLGNVVRQNVISANLIGITLGTGAAGNAVTANQIGTPPGGGDASDRPNPFGNIAIGILITGDAHDNKIGGETSGSGNVIAFTQGLVAVPGSGDGVFVQTVFGTQGPRNNPVLGNRIFSNAGLAIEVAPPTVAAPVIKSVSVAGATFTVTGTVTGPPLAAVRVEVFSNLRPKSQGENFLGGISVTTDMHGQAVFSFSFTDQPLRDLLRIVGPVFFTATATADGGTTSPFSAPVSSPQVPI
jgi:hypothetical protein